jgi:hypothetical protein
MTTTHPREAPLATPDRNALRRLQRLLDDEDYGPKLARLRGTDEQHVLGLISRNQGAAARAEINAADARRRETARASARMRLEKRAVDNQHARHREGGTHPRRAALEGGARLMSDTDLRFAAGATRDQLVQRARQPPKHLTPRGEDWNPFWYH